MTRDRLSRGIPVVGSWCWIDRTEFTAVVWCRDCDMTFGGILDPHDWQSQMFAASDHHAEVHAGEPGYSFAQAEALGPCVADDECARPRHAKRVCQAHYQRHYRTGNLIA